MGSPWTSREYFGFVQAALPAGSESAGPATERPNEPTAAEASPAEAVPAEEIEANPCDEEDVEEPPKEWIDARGYDTEDNKAVKVGGRIEVAIAFNSDDEENVALGEGLKGKVLEIDDDGH